jgi:hypothetical protein
MATTREDIRSWLERAKENGATHVIVVCDTFDHEDYPVEVMPGTDVRKKAEDYENGKNMQRIMEVYALHLDLEMQLKEHRSFHYEYPKPVLISRKRLTSKSMKSSQGGRG